MPIAVATDTHSGAGSFTAVVNARTTPGNYMFSIDLTAMDAGDVVQVKISTVMIDGGTAHTAFLYNFSYANAVAEAHKYSVVIPSTHSITVEINAPVGDDYPWELIFLSTPTVAATGTHSGAGSLTAVVDNNTTANNYIFGIDLTAIDAADIVQVKISTKEISGGSYHTAHDYYFNWLSAQVEAHKYSVPIPVTNGITVEINAPAGDDYPWELIAL